jgi:hypothetical protein
MDYEPLLAIPDDAYWYLGSPYTKFEPSIDAANVIACRVAARLFKARVRFFAPIPHSHCIAIYGGADPRDHEGWMMLDGPLMKWAYGLIVIRVAGWKESIGLTQEIARFDAAGKPITHVDPLEWELAL